jgi:hypothetical protein
VRLEEQQRLLEQQKQAKEIEDEKKKARLDEQQRQLQQQKQAKQQQEHQLDLQNMAFQADLNQQRQAWLFDKEKNAYNDQRKVTLDGNAARAADETGAELYRRERSLSQNNFDRRIHTKARDQIAEKRYSSEFSVEQDDGKKQADKEEKAAGDADNPDDGDAGDEDDSGERVSFNPYFDD